jgi:hypothetical protein
VVHHFAECVREGKTPLSDGQLGLRVVRLLEAGTRSMRAQGGRVVLSNGAGANGTAQTRTNTRTNGSGQLHPDRPGRTARQRRNHALLR